MMESAGPEAAGGLLVFVLWMACIGVALIVNLIGFAFWIWMLIDCCQNEPKQPDSQVLLWVLVILLANWIGAAVYYFVRRANRPPAGNIVVKAGKPI